MLAPGDTRQFRGFPPLVIVAAIPCRCACPHCNGAGWIIDADAALIVAIAAATRDRVFTARELLRHARAVGGPLQAAVDGMSARQLGKRLQRIAGRIYDGFHVERIGASNRGALWRAFRE